MSERDGRKINGAAQADPYLFGYKAFERGLSLEDARLSFARRKDESADLAEQGWRDAEAEKSENDRHTGPIRL